MNKHLKPVFYVLLPGLEKAKIDYWVYGGVSVAAYAGEFIRENKDVDIFVREEDFKKAVSILQKICNENNFKPKYCQPKEKNEKPKLDIKIDNEKRFSIIPVFLKNGSVEFKYPKGNEKYSDKILERVERNISGYRFFTPRNEYIKEIFINHITSRPDKKKRKNFQKDAKAILNSDELAELDWPID